MRHLFCLTTLTSLTLLGACGGAQPAHSPEATPGGESGESAAAPAANQAELAAMFEREAGGLQKKPVADPKGEFNASVGASAAPTINQVEGRSVVEIPIGTEAPVRCQLFPEEVDVGGTLGMTLRELTGKVQPKRVAAWAVRVVADAPASFVSVLYHAPSPRGNLVGELKLALHALPDRPVLCMHDEPGYRKTFETVVSDFGGSLKLKQRPAARAYLDVQTVHVGDVPMGFSTSWLSTKEGKREFSTSSTLMVAQSEADLTFQDRLTLETIDAQDRLLRGVWVEAQGGEVSLSVTLDPVKGKAGTYRYEGKLQGKPVSGEITTKDRKPLPSSVATLKRVARDGKKAGAFSVTDQRYSPNLDPTRLLEMKYFRAANDSPKSFRFEAGSLKVSGVLDDQGLIERAELPAGAATLTFRREVQRGKL